MTIDEAIAHAREVAKESRENIITGENLEQYESDCNVKCEQCAEEHEQLAEWMEELKQYRAIGTVVECRAAVEKMKQKKPIDRCMFSECPTCGNVEIQFCKHCSDCGQALIW